jgi:hypothetical protein
MCCYHRKVRTPKCERRTSESGVWRLAFGVGRSGPCGTVRRCLGDDRGVATVEGILVFALLVGVLLGCILLGQWGTQLQNSQMGARLLAFDAGDANLARFGRAGDTALRTVTTGSWDTLATGLPTNWLNVMFTSLTDDRSAGRVRGRQRGRLASQGPSLFDFASSSMGYFSTSAAGSNSWAGTAASAKSTFMGIAYYVGRYRVSPQSIGAKPSIPATTPVLESIYVRSGVR